MTLWRVEVGPRDHVSDTLGNRVGQKIYQELGMAVHKVSTVKVFTVAGLDEQQIQLVMERHVLDDPILHVASLSPLPAPDGFDWTLEVGFRPGVTDNEGRTAAQSVAMVLGLPKPLPRDFAVYTATRYLLSGNLTEADVRRIAADLLANELIQRFEIKSFSDWQASSGFPARAAQVVGRPSDTVQTIPLSGLNDKDLMEISRKGVLALSLDEMQAIRGYYERPEIRSAREAQGLPEHPTDVELEALAQTWSEHCKHKIFCARITYRNRDAGRTETVNSLYKTFIQNPTATLRRRMGKDDICLSVFKDNAGVIRFAENHNICIKVETHNSPSALDPYGGALTGIVGVNRDPMGTGLGANLLCNTDVFCLGSPFYDQPLPPRLLHPRRVLEGVREGVEHGGNKSGIPTVNGSLVFHERFLGKPLIFCGTIGIMPAMIGDRPSHIKKARPGDVIVMVGGRIGKDGIHGATFSSEELHEDSPATAVQIGDPITQRKMYDFLMVARDRGLYQAITDNGAGGLSSSVGEMAQDSGGCDLDLHLAPLKYDGLMPWEILLSEAQERMTAAVAPQDLEAFLALAEQMDVEATALGHFTDSGLFHIRFGQKTVGCLEMAFLHEGTPQMQLEAEWIPPTQADVEISPTRDHGDLLKRILGRLNVCSKEYVIRQYDHEVQGGSVIKPLMGPQNDGPTDAAVLRPLLDSDTGLVVSHGICPKFSDLDTYWMTANAVDEAVRNAVAVGADPSRMAGVDNFCWCDPVQSEKTPDGRYKLAQLVRANQALAHYCLAYGVPCVSGKDSMKNDYSVGGVKISVPPTVLFSLVGMVEDVRTCVTSDFKQPGDAIYLLGTTRNELGGSEFASELGLASGHVPQVDALANRRRYQTLHATIRAGLVRAAHDLSDGGLGVAVAEMAIAGRLGAEIDLALVPACPGELASEILLYSESAGRLLVCVAPEQTQAFEEHFRGQILGRIGRVIPEPFLRVNHGPSTIIAAAVEELTAAWKATMNW
ncbi:phosphoribosylformylglycinamidine synthase subunit II [Desulfonatronum thiosulfatophilum]|uniref:Phosphoribosylformylglycinamidine synthase subunit PurL n=1 Tax=Desulfonatronum thiosulfatophilum TaxID=617002 RepID=A0A1G6D6K3_9BACT|nr:AIR synthase-related protein [Desulfonatronum thiosulfatophilum]SDB40763.1 phosphoribosylformylglycinamidine synthase subunit II [Desulfonatronum thiosulfatophilum]